ncbi:MAG: hypothetical protein KQJ78_00020 [Deltaproteobacteria bacterium]|nr:hypothetical protein [Deltaproteobacteria bacterium]
MKNELALYCLYAGGLLHVGWGLFHLAFPRLFKWDQTLAPLNPVNRSIMLVMNLCLAFVFITYGYLSVVFAPEMLTTALGRKLIGALAAFWLLRLGLQFKFFRTLHPASLALILCQALTMGVYAYPLLHGAA